MNELVEKRHCIIQKIRNGIAWNYYYFFFELALSESETEDFIKKAKFKKYGKVNFLKI